MKYAHWSSPIARSIIQSTQIGDPRKAIITDATALLEEIGVKKPPIDLRIVASYQRIKDIQYVHMRYAGRLIPEGREFIMQVNEIDTPGRQNFTIAHEIGHTLLHRYNKGTMMQIIEDRTSGSYRRQEELEYLCDQAATELLMPAALFRPLAASMGCSLDTVIELAELFASSYESTAIRLVEMDLWPCAFVVWHEDLYAPPKTLSLKYAIRSKNFCHLLPASLSVRADGYIPRCFRSSRKGAMMCGNERFKCGRKKVTFFVMAHAVDTCYAGRQIYSLLLPSDGAD